MSPTHPGTHAQAGQNYRGKSHPFSVKSSQQNTTVSQDKSSIVELKIKVVPNASKSEIMGWVGDSLKIRIQAVPEDGKANKALIEFLSRKFNLSRRSVELVAGETSREKRVRITGLTQSELNMCIAQ
jgi:uncharacterized protein (TIGR00251 family)